MMWETLGTVRDLGRLQEIAVVLIRYGFGDLVRRIGMAGALEKAGKALHWRAPEELARLEPPARVRRVLEDLGPSFTKVGPRSSSTRRTRAGGSRRASSSGARQCSALPAFSSAPAMPMRRTRSPKP